MSLVDIINRKPDFSKHCCEDCKEAQQLLEAFDAPVGEPDPSAWSTLPRGWTTESLQSFWTSLGGTVITCSEALEGHLDDPGIFCSTLKDKVLGTTAWRDPKSKRGRRAEARNKIETGAAVRKPGFKNRSDKQQERVKFGRDVLKQPEQKLVGRTTSELDSKLEDAGIDRKAFLKEVNTRVASGTPMTLARREAFDHLANS